MLKLAKFVLPVGVLLIGIAVSFADKDSKESKVSKTDAVACKGDKCEVACSDCQGPVAKAMDALPKLVYRIGEETTTSPIQAGRIATKTKHKIEFVVGEKVFKEESVAFVALVDTTEKFVGDFAKPQECKVSGQTLVAGKSVCCEVAAGQVASLVKTAMDDVKITYKVGKETVCCPDAAQALAKKSGEKVVKMVAGQRCGGCSSTTRLSLARAKYKAAIEALLAADKNESGDNSEAKRPAEEI